MFTQPNADDFHSLQEHYTRAMKVADEMTWLDDYPEYPDTVIDLMNYINTSPWCDVEYPPEKSLEIFENVKTADLLEVRSALTAISRAERFCTGSWITAFNDGKLKNVIERARELCSGVTESCAG